MALLPFLLLGACGNSDLSCSDADSKQLLRQSLADHYTDVFGQFAYIVEPGTIEASVSGITTLSSDQHSAKCSARASFTYQNRKAVEPKAQHDIDGLVALIGPRKTEVEYELRKTDDGELELKFNEIR